MKILFAKRAPIRLCLGVRVAHLRGRSSRGVMHGRVLAGKGIEWRISRGKFWFRFWRGSRPI